MLLVVGPFGAEPFPRATPQAVGLNAAKLDEATRLMKALVAEKKIAGAVAAVARHGKLAYLESAGVQNLETGSPMTERSLFRIYPHNIFYPGICLALAVLAINMLGDGLRDTLDPRFAKRV